MEPAQKSTLVEEMPSLGLTRLLTDIEARNLPKATLLERFSESLTMSQHCPPSLLKRLSPLTSQKSSPLTQCWNQLPLMERIQKPLKKQKLDPLEDPRAPKKHQILMDSSNLSTKEHIQYETLTMNPTMNQKGSDSLNKTCHGTEACLSMRKTHTNRPAAEELVNYLNSMEKTLLNRNSLSGQL